MTAVSMAPELVPSIFDVLYAHCVQHCHRLPPKPEILLALDLAGWDVNKAWLVLNSPLFSIARGDELEVSRYLNG